MKARSQKTVKNPAPPGPAPPPLNPSYPTMPMYSPFPPPMPFYPPYPPYDMFNRDRDYYRYSPGHAKRQRDEIPSSDGIEEPLEDPSIFPLVDAWLQSLDEGMRGKDGHNFAQYSEALTEAMFTRVSDIADGLNVSTLREVVGDMPFGTASAMIRYAEADTKSIRDRVLKKKVVRYKESVAGPSRRQ